MNIIERPSPNFNKGRGGKKIVGIVLHGTDGDFPGCLTWLTNPAAKASAHYLIDRPGPIYRLVKEEDTAWHCRGYNETTIGIELVCQVTAGQDYTDEQYDSLNALLADIRTRQSNPWIKPHSELDPERRHDPGPKFDWPRILAIDPPAAAEEPSPWADDAWWWSDHNNLMDGNPHGVVTREMLAVVLFRFKEVKHD